MLGVCSVRQDFTLLSVTSAMSLTSQLFYTVLLQCPVKIAVLGGILIRS
jgi:hypothetical protein